MYAQLLISLSFVIASYQDVKDRAVSDLVWVPALVGAVYAFYEAGPNLEFGLIKLGLVGGIGLAFTLYGGIGQADAIAMAFVASDPNPLSPIPPLFAAALVALSHIGYEAAVGNAGGSKTIPVEVFLREQRWIPKVIVSGESRTEVNRDVNQAREEVAAKHMPGDMVEVSYGVPTVAYLGVGYVAYLVYLVVFTPLLFTTLP